MNAVRRGADLPDVDYANLAETRRLLRSHLAFSERAAESAGLEPRHYQLLLMLRGLTPDGAASISDLAGWLQVRHHSAVGLVDRMEARGLVERCADPLDGRRVLVVLTAQSRSAWRCSIAMSYVALRLVWSTGSSNWWIAMCASPAPVTWREEARVKLNWRRINLPRVRPGTRTR